MQRTLFDYVQGKVAANGGGSSGRGATTLAKNAAASTSLSSSSAHDDAAAPRKRQRTHSPDATRSTSLHSSSSDADAHDAVTVPSSPHARTCATSASTSSSRWLADLITSTPWRHFLAPLLADTWHNGLFARIERFLDEQAAQGKVVFPPRQRIFGAFNSTPFDELKVVLLGQDPYHNYNQAHGLSFSVMPGVTPPPSLLNMYKELTSDIPGFVAPRHGYLQSWAEQGMLMLNATLTVEAGKANSHSKCGWQTFTDDVIRRLSAHHRNRLVFLLWGNFAKKKRALIDGSRHVIIEAAHPSPLSAALWWNCKCFSKCNEALHKLGHTPMTWQLPQTAAVIDSEVSNNDDDKSK